MPGPRPPRFASAAGVTLGGVLSVSVSTSDSYGIAMGVSNVEPPTAAGGPSTTLPTPGPAQPTSPELFVSVTVEYQIG